MQLTVLDRNKLSFNDHVGDAAIETAELAENVPEKDPATGMYPEDEDGTRTKLPLVLRRKAVGVEICSSNHIPVSCGACVVVELRTWVCSFTNCNGAKYQPYDAQRQRLWSELLMHYDTDDTLTVSHIELKSMLDSLGSTLSVETIDSSLHAGTRTPHRRTDVPRSDTVPRNGNMQTKLGEKSYVRKSGLGAYGSRHGW